MSENQSQTADPPRMLVASQCFDQPTFHTLYEAVPPGTRTELIGGVVFMPSPVGRAQGRAQVPVIVWLNDHAENPPGVEGLDSATAIRHSAAAVGAASPIGPLDRHDPAVPGGRTTTVWRTRHENRV